MTHEHTDAGTLLVDLAPEADLFEILRTRRGWTDEFLQAIENGNHDDLKDLDMMTEALHHARENGRVVTIAPDFDMDGISSGVLGYAGLSELGFTVNLYLPDYRRGHDLTPADIEDIHRVFPDTDLLLTCDGGVNSHDGIAAAKAKGWTTLVTDHHQELEPGCTADITVNPCRLDETYANRGICGAHVLYQVLESYALGYAPESLWAIRLLRLFAGTGTVSDVMPLLYENRQLVRDSLSIARLLHVAAPKPNGQYSPAEPSLIDINNATLLQLLKMGDHHPVFIGVFEGFAILLKAFAEHGKLRDIDELDEGFYGFYLAPAMNSPRRTESPLEPCFMTFIAETAEEKHEAITAVIENNERRKQMVIELMQEIDEGNQPLAPWVYFSSGPTGMFGLLANTLMQRSGHPTVVVPVPGDANEPTSGSGRAPGWFSIIDELEAAGNPGIFAVGHQQACGVKVTRTGFLGELARILEKRTAERHAELDPSEMRPATDLVLGDSATADAPLSDIDPLFELIRRVEGLRPFGHDFPEPVYEIALDLSGLRVDRIGSEKTHLRLVTPTGLACLWWNSAEEHHDRMLQMVDRATATGVSRIMRFTGKLQINSFRGNTRVQVILQDPLPDDAAA